MRDKIADIAASPSLGSVLLLLVELFVIRLQLVTRLWPAKCGLAFIRLATSLGIFWSSYNHGPWGAWVPPSKALHD
jgi:hypothetical protein